MPKKKQLEERVKQLETQLIKTYQVHQQYIKGELPQQAYMQEMKKLDEFSPHSILSQYTDIINKQGITSKEAKAFRKKYKYDKELSKLFQTVNEVKVMFLEGDLL